jgi:hypothetical protein
MLQKALTGNNLFILILGGVLLFAVEASALIEPEALGTAVRVGCIFIATGLGVYKKPS